MIKKSVIIALCLIFISFAKISSALLPDDYKELPRDKQVDALVIALSNHDTTINCLLNELKEYGNAVVPDLIALLDKYGTLGDAAKVDAVITVMGYYSSDTLIDPLMAQLERDKDLRERIFNAVSGINLVTKSEKVYRTMIKIYKEYPMGVDWATRDIVYDADEAKIPILIELLNDVDFFVRKDMIMNRFAEEPWEKHRDIIVPAVVGMLKSGNDAYRGDAAYALSGMGAKSSIPALKEAMNVEKETPVKIRMAKALVILDDFKSAEYLVNLIKSFFANEREMARDALMDISGQDFGEDYIAWRKWFDDEKTRRGL